MRILVFLSSVSVYGEENLGAPVSEDSDYQPSSDYAKSKLNAERRLIALCDGGAGEGDKKNMTRAKILFSHIHYLVPIKS